MLVLGRKIRQSTVLNVSVDEMKRAIEANKPIQIEAEVVQLSRSLVRIGWTAPESVQVNRKEVLDRAA